MQGFFVQDFCSVSAVVLRKSQICFCFLQGGDCEVPLAPLQPPNPLQTLFVQGCFGSFLLLLYINLFSLYIRKIGFCRF